MPYTLTEQQYKLIQEGAQIWLDENPDRGGYTCVTISNHMKRRHQRLHTINFIMHSLFITFLEETNRKPLPYKAEQNFMHVWTKTYSGPNSTYSNRNALRIAFMTWLINREEPV